VGQAAIACYPVVLKVIARFFSTVIANVSEEMLMDFMRLCVREWALKRKKGDIAKAIADLKTVVEQTATEGMTTDEKNSYLITAGRAVADRMRDN
jgi:hypothetical protein